MKTTNEVVKREKRVFESGLSQGYEDGLEQGKQDAKKKFIKLIEEIKTKHLFLDELKLFIKELKQKLGDI